MYDDEADGEEVDEGVGEEAMEEEEQEEDDEKEKEGDVTQAKERHPSERRSRRLKPEVEGKTPVCINHLAQLQKTIWYDPCLCAAPSSDYIFSPVKISESLNGRLCITLLS